MKKIALIGIILFLFINLNLFCEELKIGYVDIFEVFNEYEKTKDYDKILEEKKASEKKKLDEKEEKIKKMQDKLLILSGDAQDKQREKISKAMEEYKDLRRQIFADLKKERDEKMMEIIEDINKTIEEYAKKEEFDLIINENAILYGKKSMDITSEILKRVNEKYKK
jgi:outer membrane protein